MPIGYKVVKRLKNGDRVSNMVLKESGVRETYIHNGKPRIVPQGMVFSNYHDASCFGFISEGRELWKCQFSHSQHISKTLGLNDMVSLTKKQNLEALQSIQFMRSRYSIVIDDKVYYFRYAPNGTLLAKNIELLERLQ